MHSIRVHTDIDEVLRLNIRYEDSDSFPVISKTENDEFEILDSNGTAWGKPADTLLEAIYTALGDKCYCEEDYYDEIAAPY
tara:strand:+ start:2581 stop:2823 length:243 start_codon:yes stop_codon:yes gene_type:complete